MDAGHFYRRPGDMVAVIPDDEEDSDDGIPDEYDDNVDDPDFVLTLNKRETDDMGTGNEDEQASVSTK